MVKKTFTITDEAGLHARPASLLCAHAGKFPGDVNIVYNDQTYTLKSIMILMSLGIPQGGVITIEVDGENEQEHLDELRNILEEHKLV